MSPNPAGRLRLHADVHRLLGIMLQRDVSDPRLAGVAVTRIEAARHGRLLKVWVHGMDVDPEMCVTLLNRLRPHFMHGLRRALPRRRLPELRFVWDKGLDTAAEIDRLLRHGMRR